VLKEGDVAVVLVRRTAGSFENEAAASCSNGDGKEGRKTSKVGATVCVANKGRWVKMKDCGVVVMAMEMELDDDSEEGHTGASHFRSLVEL
jgi:hypothetical protein